MKKIFVLDTNVLLADPNAIYTFEDNEVIIPSVVLQELDSKKSLMDELGRNARYVSRQLDKLRENGKLNLGVKLKNGGLLKVASPPQESYAYDAFIDNSNDTAIIATAYSIQSQRTDADVIVVSKDVLVRVKADMWVKSEDYFNDKIISSNDDKYTGLTELEVPDREIDLFYKTKKLNCDLKIHENYYIHIISNIDNKKGALTRYNKGKLQPLYNYSDGSTVFDLMPKNKEQKLAFDLLLDKNIPLVTLTGKAGTGKTLLSLAASLQQVQDGEYHKVIVARPVIPMGRDIGFLPGDIDEKLRPWMQPIYDNLEFLFNCKNQDDLQNMLQGYENIIQVEALTYIRGRSIPNQFIIIDEAQNLTQHEAKTILTRVGENSKIVLVGDTEQIDHPYLDAYSNGLTYVIEKMKHLRETGHITLTRGERSNLAQLCADLL